MYSTCPRASVRSRSAPWPPSAVSSTGNENQQERFRTAIHGFPAVVATAEKMVSILDFLPRALASASAGLTSGLLRAQVKAAALLDVPVVVTEQNPKGASHHSLLHIDES